MNNLLHVNTVNHPGMYHLALRVIKKKKKKKKRKKKKERKKKSACDKELVPLSVQSSSDVSTCLVVLLTQTKSTLK